MKLYYSKSGYLIKWDDLIQLKNGNYLFYYKMFDKTEIEISFPNLLSGIYMFYHTNLTSFSGDLSSLVDGYFMFGSHSLTSFSGDLSSLVDGRAMFYQNPLTSFNGKNLKKLAFANDMFYNCKLSIPSVERIAEQVFDYANMNWDSLPILFNSGQSMPSEEEIQLKDEGLYVYNNTTNNRYYLYCIYGRYDDTGKYHKNLLSSGASYDKSSKTLVQGNKITLYVDEEQVADATYMARLQAAFDTLAAKGWDVVSNISMISSILEGDEITKDTSIYAKVETQIDENRSNEYTHVDANGNNVLLRTAKYIGPRLTDWQLFASIEDAEQHFGITPIK